MKRTPLSAALSALLLTLASLLVSTSAEASRASGASAVAASQAHAPGVFAPEARAVERALALGDGALETDTPQLALFAGDELDAVTRTGAPAFHLDGAELPVPPLASEVEASYPKTRVRAFDFLGQEVIGVERELSLTLHWGSGHFGLELASGSGNWLSEDPAGTVDSPSLYAFVGNRPNLATDPLGTCVSWRCALMFRFANQDPSLAAEARQVQDAAAKANAVAATAATRTATTMGVALGAGAAALTAPVSVPIMLAGGGLLAGQQLHQDYDVRRTQQVVAGHGTRGQAFGLAVADTTGMTGVVEGLTEYRVVTGAPMTKAEAGAALSGGAFDLGLTLAITASLARPGAQAARYTGNFAGDTYATIALNFITRRASSSVDAAIAANDFVQLRALGAGPGEAMGGLSGGSMAEMFRGSIIDTLVKTRASSTFGLRRLHYTQRFEYGPDIWNPATRRAWDVTTPWQWGPHVERYVTSPPAYRPTWLSLDPLYTR